MKKSFLYITLFIPLLFLGCGGSSKEGYTSDLNLHQSAPGFFTETDYGYYYNENGFFYYSEKENVNFQKLCNKPNCLHNDENCNAYNNPDCFLDTNFCNGRLFYAYPSTNSDGGLEIVIESKDLDGSNTKREKTINQSYGHFSGKMHRNYYVYNLIVEEDGKQYSRLYMQDLDQIKEDPEMICEYSSGMEERIPTIYADAIVGDTIYYSVNEKMYRYAITEKDISEIPLEATMRKGMYFTEDEIFAIDLEDNFQKVDVEHKAVTQLSLEEVPYAAGPIFFDETYMYQINYSYGSVELPEEAEGIVVYDREGAFVTFIPYSLPTNNEMYFVAARDKVFLFRMPGYGAITSYSYFDKEDIETGTVSWTDVE